MNFTADQKRVIEARGKNLLVAAAAGSGKTTVLIQRVLGLMEEGVGIDEMLIVTFTRAASADMRRKLSERLYELADAGNEGAAEQLEKLEYAFICTLDSFCGDVIRSYFELADCDPNYRILDEAQNARMEREALDEALENAYANGIGVLGEGRSPSEIRALAEAMFSYVQNRPNPEKWIEKSIELACSDGAVWASELAKEMYTEIDNAVGLLSNALDVCRLPGAPDKYLGTLEQDIEMLNAFKRHGFHDMCEMIRSVSWGRLPTVKKDTVDAELQDTAKKLRDDAKDIIKKLKTIADIPFEASMEDIRSDVPAVRKLFEIVSDMQSRLWEAKKETGALTFSDLERRTLAVLGDDEAAAAIRDRYKYIFVDEYQDTSDIQEAIVGRITREDNLFMVGDVKQSIYRFRSAEPRLFLKKQKEYRQGGINELIVLKENFRSRSCVIDFVNRVFERVMNGGRSEIVYDDDERLNRGRDFEGPDSPAEILIGVREGYDDGEEDDEREELDKIRFEGRMIARRISEMMEADASLRYRDFCVLTRTNAVLPGLAEELADCGINSYTDASEHFFDMFEVNLVMSVLKLVVSGRNDLDMLALLRSPVIAMTDADIADMRLDNPDMSLWDAAVNSRTRFAACEKAVKLIEDLRVCAYGLGINRLIRRFLTDTGFYAFAGALEGGCRRQGNLDILCAKAYRFEKDTAGSLADFIDYAENLRSGEDKSGAHELGEGDNVVRLMSQHKSKGLEFKVVFVAGLDGKVKKADRGAGDLYMDDALGCTITHVDTKLVTKRETVAARAIKSSETARGVAEELRILYVALTRAQEKLIMTGTVKDIEKAKQDWLIQRHCADSYKTGLDIVCAAAIGCAGAEELGGKAESGAPNVNVRLFTASDLSVSTTVPDSVQIKEFGWDEKLEAEMNWKYPDEVTPYAPVKLAVTGLEREFTGGFELPEVRSMPEFMSGDEKRSPAGRGTAVHQALRNLDYERLRGITEKREMDRTIQAQLDEMAACGQLLPEESELVTSEMITGFVLSDVGKRLLASDTVKREWSFCLRMPTERVIDAYPSGSEIFVQGTIDLCFIEDGKWVLADYKVSRTTDENELIERYSSQLNLYAEALETLTGISVKEAILCLVASGRTIKLKTERWKKRK